VWKDKQIETAYVSFELGPDGAMERIRMKPVSPLADFSYDYQDLNLVLAPITVP
jgi:hypothetical protein